MRRSALVNRFTRLRPKSRYLEIGICKGETFVAVQASEKVAVDPKIRFDYRARTDPTESYFEMTSDHFFERPAIRKTLFDVCFIDGLHTFEQTFRDFTNVLLCSTPHVVIIIDDVSPANWVGTLPHAMWLKVKPMFPDQSGWYGDVYKIVAMIETFFPRVEFRFPVEAPGQLVCWIASSARSLDDVTTRNLAEVAQAGFAEFVVEKKKFASTPLATVIEEYLAVPRLVPNDFSARNSRVAHARWIRSERRFDAITS